MIGDAGSTGGPIMVGSIADMLGLSLATFTIASVGLVAAATLGLLVPETLHTSSVPEPGPDALAGRKDATRSTP